MICPKCGQSVRDDAAYCGNCGARMAAESGTVCPSCGTAAKAGAAFCVKCGAQLTKGARSAPVQDRSGSAELLYTMNPSRHYKTLEGVWPMTVGTLRVWSDRVEYAAGLSPMESAVAAQGMLGHAIAKSMVKSKQEGRSRSLRMRDIQFVQYVDWKGPGAKMTVTLRSGEVEIFGGTEEAVQICVDRIKGHRSP